MLFVLLKQSLSTSPKQKKVFYTIFCITGAYNKLLVQKVHLIVAGPLIKQKEKYAIDRLQSEKIR